MKTFIKKLVEKLREENPDMQNNEAIKHVVQQIKCKKAMGDEELEDWKPYVAVVVKTILLIQMFVVNNN